jgi:ABC-2 type transport system permease protein
MNSVARTMTAAASTAPAVGVRTGFGYWFTSYRIMLRWELLSMRLFLPMMVAVQFFIGAGMVVGLGFLFDRIPPQQALYLSTGGAVIPLLTLGLVMVPQEVSSFKLEGTYDFLWSLPVPRMAAYLASLTVWSLVALPAGVAALIVAAMRFDIAFHVSPLVVPAAVLVVVVATAVGYAFASALPNPRVTNLITQVLIFAIVIFSPINFPADRLPGWLSWLHQWLPFESSAIVMRGTLADGLVASMTRAFIVLGVWAVLSWIVTYRVLSRRG